MILIQVAKLIGAGIAVSSISGAGVGIGSVFASLIKGVARNPSLVQKRLFQVSAFLCANNNDITHSDINMAAATQLMSKYYKELACKNPTEAAVRDANAWFIFAHEVAKACNVPTTKADQMQVDLLIKEMNGMSPLNFKADNLAGKDPKDPK